MFILDNCLETFFPLQHHNVSLNSLVPSIMFFSEAWDNWGPPPPTSARGSFTIWLVVEKLLYAAQVQERVQMLGFCKAGHARRMTTDEGLAAAMHHCTREKKHHVLPSQHAKHEAAQLHRQKKGQTEETEPTSSICLLLLLFVRGWWETEGERDYRLKGQRGDVPRGI